MKKSYLKKGNQVIRFATCITNCGKEFIAILLTNYGCTYEEETIRFNSADEGNAYYVSMRNCGFCKADSDDYDRIVYGY